MTHAAHQPQFARSARLIHGNPQRSTPGRQPVAVCSHCKNPFGANEGWVSPDFSLCDTCNG